MNWIRICKAQIEPVLVDVASQSEPGVVHTAVTKTLFSDSFCTCKGFLFRGYCKHTTILDEQFCRWFARMDDAEASLEFTPPKACPMCGGETIKYTFDLEFNGD